LAAAFSGFLDRTLSSSLVSGCLRIFFLTPIFRARIRGNAVGSARLSHPVLPTLGSARCRLCENG
jgi:hypothetical protein